MMSLKTMMTKRQKGRDMTERMVEKREKSPRRCHFCELPVKMTEKIVFENIRRIKKKKEEEIQIKSTSSTAHL